MERPMRLGGAVSVALLLWPATACTTSTVGQAAVDAKKPTAASATPSATAHPTLRTAPRLDSDETLAGQRKPTTGNAEIPFEAGKEGDALIVELSCQGRGTVKVALCPVDVSFETKCAADEVGTTRNEVAVGAVHRAGAAAVEAPAGVRWALTVGRGERAEGE
ncbi:hypothetical protein [Streptomyces sp. NPDC087294]|uniref:hypothetical protein n=1 Tax=Streptomyces sp. NPDC087294 TaxID=3365777 RepID=UPI00382BFEC2